MHLPQDIPLLTLLTSRQKLGLSHNKEYSRDILGLIVLENDSKEAVGSNHQVPAGAKKVCMGWNSEGSG